MSAQNSAGIQTLLDAEREAQKIVQRAREYTNLGSPSEDLKVEEWGVNGADRTKRVKEARDEAKKEVEEYRKAKEDEFKKFEAEHSSGNKKAEEDADTDAVSKMKEIKEAGKKGQDQVVKSLLKAVFDIKPVVPERIEVPK